MSFDGAFLSVAFDENRKDEDANMTDKFRANKNGIQPNYWIKAQELQYPQQKPLEWLSAATLQPVHQLAQRELKDIATSLKQVEDQRNQLLQHARTRCVRTADPLSVKPISRQKSAPQLSQITQNRLLRAKTPHWVDRYPDDMSQCHACGVQVHVRDMKIHLANECDFRVITCRQIGCDAKFEAHMQEDHEKNICIITSHRKKLAEHRPALVKCELCHEMIPERFQAKHLRTECVERVVPCSNKNFGCKEMLKFKDLHEHETNGTCLVSRLAAQVRKEAAEGNTLTVCDWCDEEMPMKRLFDHQEEHCPSRERHCRNRKFGCREWVPVRDMEKHLKECIVTLENRQRAQSSRAREAFVPCPECGERQRIRLMRKHMEEECINRIVRCRNHMHGCKAMIRLRDRDLHENIQLLNQSRSCLYFNGINSAINLQPLQFTSGADQANNTLDTSSQSLPPPWTAEWWIWRNSAYSEIILLFQFAVEWSAKLYDANAKYVQLQTQYKETKQNLDNMKKEAAKNPKAEFNESEADALIEKLRVIAIDRSNAYTVKEECITRIKIYVKVAYRLFVSLENPEKQKEIKNVLCSVLDKLKEEYRSFFTSGAAEPPVAFNVGKEEPIWHVPRQREFYEDLAAWYSYLEDYEAKYEQAQNAAQSDERKSREKAMHRKATIMKELRKINSRRTSDKQSARLLRRYTRELKDLEMKLPSSDSSGAVGTFGRGALASCTDTSIFLEVGTGKKITFMLKGEPCSFNYIVPRETWTHISFTATENTLSLYANGEFVDNVQTSAPLPLARIGGEQDSFFGYLQEVRYWSAIRSPALLRQYLHEPLPVPVLNLHGYWTFEEGHGKYVADVSNNVPRSSTSHTEWIEMDNSRVLGEPPTFSFRERHICRVSIHRMRLSKRAILHSSLVPCKLKCGEEVPVNQLDRHLRDDCINRMVKCDKLGCNDRYRFQDSDFHSRRCRPQVHMRVLAEKYHESMEQFPCPFGCGRSITRREQPKHLNKQCPLRLVSCRNPGCSDRIRARNQLHHESNECESAWNINRHEMVSRARTRQSTRAKVQVGRLEPRPHTTTDHTSEDLVERSRDKQH